MRYASIISAETGWEVILVDVDGNPHIHQVKKWGMPLVGSLVPLDDAYESFIEKENFIALINPNEERPSQEVVANKCFEVAAVMRASLKITRT